MTSTNNDAVAERRLRPIYDWLDNGNNKKAIQEADKVLKKQPDLLCAQVLKGLALLRIGKIKDCEEILDNVQKKMPADDCTLQAMTICFREVQKLEKICEIYEKAVQKDPFSEELNTHLFMSYVRIGDYKKQQQAALNLYKIKPKNPYYFWGVMSILMQVYTNDEKFAQKVTLPLAERMVKKFIDEGKLEAEQEILLYIMILEMQNKYQDALDVIDGDLGQKVMSYYMLSRKKIKFLQMLEKWDDLNIYIKKIISEEPDAFDHYVIYIDSVFNVMKMDSCIKRNSNSKSDDISSDLCAVDDSIEKCIAFIERCKESSSRIHQIRGPYLASLLLYKNLGEKECDPVHYVGSLLELFKKYFELFGSKACCFKDLYQFLHLMKTDYVSLLSTTLSLANKTSDQKNFKQMMMYLTHFEISRYFGVYEMLSVAEKLAEVSKLFSFYNTGHKYNKNNLPTDVGCSDTFMLLVGHFLHDLYLDTNDFKFIKDAICMLEYAYYYSPSNHHFKLLLLRFYNILGASMAEFTYFQALEVKHMQYDSLGYLICWSLLYSGQYSSAVLILENTLKFFNINYREAADQLTHAYKYGSFEKVREFISFREKLKNSAHHNLVSIEHALHELICLPSHAITVHVARNNFEYLECEVPDLSHLVDNRDLTLFLSFDSDSRRMNKKYQKLTFEHDLALIRLRSVILRCLRASIKYSSELNCCFIGSKSNCEHPQTNGVMDISIKNAQILSNAIRELKSTCEMFKNNPLQKLPKTILSGVTQSKYFLYVESPFFLKFFAGSMDLIQEFCSNCRTNEPSQKNELKYVAQKASEVFSVVVIDVEKKLQTALENPDETDHRSLFEFFSLAIETMCISSVVCGVMHSALLAMRKKVFPKKKGKGREPSNDIIELETISQKSKMIKGDELDAFSQYHKILKDNISLLDKILSNSESGWEQLETHDPRFDLQLRIDSSNLDDPSDSGPINGMPEKEWVQLQMLVNKNIRNSFRSSIKQFQNIVKNKLEYLSLLTL